jgi:cytochrome c oxidase cbb3-type subunit I/II
VGILLYVGAMWTSGITQGLMLNATTEGGSVLAYPNFLDTLNTIRPMMLMRVIGGGLYLVGFLIMAYNLVRTIRGAQPVDGTIEVFARSAVPQEERLGAAATLFNPPVVFSALGTLFACVWMFGGPGLQIVGLFGGAISAILAVAHFATRGTRWAGWHERLLVSAASFTVLTFVAVAAGGLIQIIPTVVVNKAQNMEDRIAVPYTPLELAGRDIYVREGCYNCHSQMIRTIVPDVLRYGDYSRMGESLFDHPFQWGSRRGGPDLARVGDKYNAAWHFVHMADPRATSPGSNMPAYPWLYTNRTDVASLYGKLNVQRMLAVPYPAMSPAEVQANVGAQAKAITDELKATQQLTAPDREIVALIAYLQRLGKYETVAPRTAALQP